MPGKHVVGLMADFRRENEGEYVCPLSTVFGLEDNEVQGLIKLGMKVTDNHKKDEGYEVQNSVFKVMRELGKNFGFEPMGQPVITDAPNSRKTIIFTMVKDV